MISIFTENRVYKRHGNSIRLLRIIDNAYVFIDVYYYKAAPFVLDQSKLDEEIIEGEITEVEDPWFSSVNVIYSATHPYIKKRDENFERIKPLILNPNFYKPSVRGSISDILVADGRGAKTTIYRYVRRYWQRGQNINALIPEFKSCGGKGKNKTRNKKPLGRPNSLPTAVTTQMGNSLKEMMRSAILNTILSNRTYVGKSKKPKAVFSLEKSYIHFLQRFCNGNATLIDEDRPSKASFRHYYYNDFSAEERALKKLGKKYFNANSRSLTSTVRDNLIGPGQSFSIDSTPFDFGVTDDKRLSLARPTLYVAVDDYSSAIAGFLLVLTPPSYFNAVTCLSVAVGNKVEFCEHFGMQISSDEWPTEGKPAAIFADLGSDWKTAIHEQTIETHHINAKSSGAGKPDMRSVGEQVFARIKAEMIHKVPGLVGMQVAKKAGGNDSQLDYTLMLDELNLELLKVAITLNHKKLTEWDSDPDFPADLPKTPTNIWKWGIANRTGLLPKVNRAQFWLSTLKREEATVTGDLLKIGKVQYRCPTFQGARIDTKIKNITVNVARDLDDASFIYLVPNEGESEFIKCELSPHDRRFKGMNWKDVESRLLKERLASKQADTGYLRRAVADLVGTQELVANAQAEKRSSVKDLSIKQQKSSLGNKSLMRKESSKVYNFVKPANSREGSAENKSQSAKATMVNSRTKFFMDDED